MHFTAGRGCAILNFAEENIAILILCEYIAILDFARGEYSDSHSFQLGFDSASAIQELIRQKDDRHILSVDTSMYRKEHVQLPFAGLLDLH